MIKKLLLSLTFLFFFCSFANSQIVTPTDTIPDFAANATIKSVQSGGWFSPTTWDLGRTPQAGDVVLVDSNHTVNFNGISNSNLAAVGVKGTLRFSEYNNRSLKAGTFLVYREGKLEIGTSANPFPSAYTAELVIADRLLYTTSADPQTGKIDPSQYGTGLIVLGDVEMHGEDKGKTWYSVSNEALANDTTITVESAPTGWKAGDKIVITDTRQIVLEWMSYNASPAPADLHIEEVEIASIAGNVITLTQPLQYDHLYGRDGDNVIIGTPHVANLSRNVVIRSENPEGTRGHVMFTERAKVNIANVEFVDLGRTTIDALDNTIMENGTVTHIGTNQVGRYSVHMHHLMGPVNTTNTGYQHKIVGTSIHRGEKWGISYHNAHFGLFDNNVIYDIQGSSLMTEEGNERENEFTNNIAILSGTPFKNVYQPRYGGVFEIGRPLGFKDYGYEGSGFWYTGMDNIDTGNVAANMAFAGIMYNGRPSGFDWPAPLVPNFRGAQIGQSSEWTQYAAGEGPSIRLSKDNEVYASAEGLWVGFFTNVGKITDYKIWHISQEGLYSRRLEQAEYERIYLYNDQSASNASWKNSFNSGITLYNPRYQDGYHIFKDFVVEGFVLGIDLASFKLPIGHSLPRTTLFEDGMLRNYVNVRDHTPTNGTKFSTLRDIEFFTNAGPLNSNFPGAPRNIAVKHEGSFSISTLLQESRLYIENYNKQPGVDYEFFHKIQDPDYVMYEWTGTYANPNDNCPTVGMTNSECLAAHGKTTMGVIATCTDDSDALFDGFLCQ